MIVVDANVIAYLFIQGENTADARHILQIDSDWRAPILWRSEFRSVLTLYLRKQYLKLEQTKFLMKEAENFMLDSEYQPNSDRVLDLVSHSTCSPYDCEYVVVAQDVGAPLITLDKKILSEFRGTAISMSEFLVNYL